MLWLAGITVGATAGKTAWVTWVGKACVPMMAPAAVGSTTLAVGIVAVAVVGDVPEVVEATCCTLGPPRPFVITTLALANEVPGNGEAVAEAAGISIVLNHVRYQLICKDDGNDKQQ